MAIISPIPGLLFWGKFIIFCSLLYPKPVFVAFCQVFCPVLLVVILFLSNMKLDALKSVRDIGQFELAFLYSIVSWVRLNSHWHLKFTSQWMGMKWILYWKDQTADDTAIHSLKKYLSQCDNTQQHQVTTLKRIAGSELVKLSGMKQKPLWSEFLKSVNRIH